MAEDTLTDESPNPPRISRRNFLRSTTAAALTTGGITGVVASIQFPDRIPLLRVESTRQGFWSPTLRNDFSVFDELRGRLAGPGTDLVGDALAGRSDDAWEAELFEVSSDVFLPVFRLDIASEIPVLGPSLRQLVIPVQDLAWTLDNGVVQETVSLNDFDYRFTVQQLDNGDINLWTSTNAIESVPLENFIQILPIAISQLDQTYANANTAGVLERRSLVSPPRQTTANVLTATATAAGLTLPLVNYLRGQSLDY